MGAPWVRRSITSTLWNAESSGVMHKFWLIMQSEPCGYSIFVTQDTASSNCIFSAIIKSDFWPKDRLRQEYQTTQRLPTIIEKKSVWLNFKWPFFVPLLKKIFIFLDECNFLLSNFSNSRVISVTVELQECRVVKMVRMERSGLERSGHGTKWPDTVRIKGG